MGKEEWRKGWGRQGLYFVYRSIIITWVHYCPMELLYKIQVKIQESVLQVWMLGCFGFLFLRRVSRSPNFLCRQG